MAALAQTDRAQAMVLPRVAVRIRDAPFICYYGEKPMATLDKRVDVYIEKAKPFAQPILNHLRKLVHQACPEVEEAIKWGMPHFLYKGLFCCMASFKEHCTFVFWKGSLLKDPHQLLDKAGQNTMGHFGHIANLDELPSDKIFLSYLKEAMKLNDEGVKLPKKISKKKELIVPAYFLSAVKKNKKALQTFESLSLGKKKDYIDWITDAKQETTRQKRLKTSLEWLSEGKSRSWKYENC